MPKYENILAFIDVDNCAITEESYDNIMHQLSSMGEITTAKIYGVNQKKHRAIIEHASDNGYEVAMPMRIKKRGAKVLDTRILVDVVTALHTVPNMDAVAVVCAPSDMVHLYRELKKYDIAVLALDNGDDATNALIDEPLDLGVVVELKLPKPKKPVVAKAVEEAVAEPVVEKVVEPVVEEVVAEPVVEEVAEPVAEVVEEPVVEQEPVAEVVEPQVEEPSPLTETEKLLAEIARLRHENEQISAQEEPQASNTPSTVVDDAQNLLDLVNEYRSEQPEEVEPAVEPVVEAVAEEVIETAPAADPSLALDNKDDGDLLKRIQAIREQSHGDDAELVAKLKSLLLGE